MTILIEAEVATTSVARPAEGSVLYLANSAVVGSGRATAEGSVLYLAPCAVVDRNFVLHPSYLNAVESKINQGFETSQKWV